MAKAYWTPERLQERTLARVGQEATDRAKAIKAALAAGQSQAATARTFGVHLTTVHRIAHGVIWKHVA